MGLQVQSWKDVFHTRVSDGAGQAGWLCPSHPITQQFLTLDRSLSEPLLTQLENG